ncbi:rhodanese-like domain-containing protein [Candidatus Poriferisodalis sp.]|uniref:rhodanese-like domain-containing protein n=1 Tax=Candidatus Poriferisodalis sp. TaxID=3101277 RepID=UPI003B02A868
MSLPERVCRPAPPHAERLSTREASATAEVRAVSADALKELHRRLLRGDGTELALVDARQPEQFARRHLLYAANLPTSHVRLEAAARIPRAGTPLVVCDDGGGEAEAAALGLAALGYSDIAVLDGGIDAWAAAGGQLYAGINVPSKLFGELVEAHFGTPHVPATELASWLTEGRDGHGRDVAVVDARTGREFRRMSIPTARSCPGGELVRRMHELAGNAATVVVNCAGRTRSIMGAQSLRAAGMDRVVALKDGTMGWELAGFELEHGCDEAIPEPSAQGRQRASAAAAAVAERCGVRTVDAARLQEWRADTTRTTYLMDVRTPEEFAAGHLRDATSAPGGQLVQATDEYLATRGGRVVLADHDGIGATMTASWLMQMGWDAWVLEPDWLPDGRDAPDGDDACTGLTAGDDGEAERARRSRQPPLPYDPDDACVARAAMQAYLDWEVALPELYAADDLAEFRLR